VAEGTIRDFRRCGAGKYFFAAQRAILCVFNSAKVVFGLSAGCS
jgi:hypothetical protein